jgi:hypothetical protein
MKLTTNQIIVLFKALSALNGAPRVVTVDGRERVVEEPYNLSPKARWNAAKNRGVLKRFVDTHDDVALGYQQGLRAFRKQLNPSDDAKENARKLSEEVERVNELLMTLSKEVHDVDGLRAISATGLNLKESPIPVAVIDDLMPLIDGDPDFEEKQ